MYWIRHDMSIPHIPYYTPAYSPNTWLTDGEVLKVWFFAAIPFQDFSIRENQ